MRRESFRVLEKPLLSRDNLLGSHRHEARWSPCSSKPFVQQPAIVLVYVMLIAFPFPSVTLLRPLFSQSATCLTLFRLCSGGVGFVASSTGGQISSRLLSMRSAAALLELPQVNPFPAPPLLESHPLPLPPCYPTRFPDSLATSALCEAASDTWSEPGSPFAGYAPSSSGGTFAELSIGSSPVRELPELSLRVSVKTPPYGIAGGGGTSGLLGSFLPSLLSLARSIASRMLLL